MLVLYTGSIGLGRQVSRWFEVLSHRMVLFGASMQHVLRKLQIWSVLFLVEKQSCIVSLPTLVNARILRTTVGDPTTIRLVVRVANNRVGEAHFRG